MQQDNENLNKNNKKGYLKIHIAKVNVKTKEILSIKATYDKRVHDDSSNALSDLIFENIIKSNNVAQ